MIAGNVPTFDQLNSDKIKVKRSVIYNRDTRDEADYEYDHEAFLGAEDAHEFDDLDPEESKVSNQGNFLEWARVHR